MIIKNMFLHFSLSLHDWYYKSDKNGNVFPNGFRWEIAIADTNKAEIART